MSGSCFRAMTPSSRKSAEGCFERDRMMSCAGLRCEQFLGTTTDAAVSFIFNSRPQSTKRRLESTLLSHPKELPHPLVTHPRLNGALTPSLSHLTPGISPRARNLHLNNQTKRQSRKVRAKQPHLGLGPMPITSGRKRTKTRDNGQHCNYYWMVVS